VALQIISTWAFYERHYDNVVRRLSQAVAGEISMLVIMLERPSDDWPPQRLFDLARSELALRAQLLDRSSVRAPPPSLFPSLVEERMNRALSEQLRQPFMVDTTSRGQQVEIQVDMGDKVLQVLVPLRRLFSSTAYVFLLWMVGSSIVLLSIATWFMRSQVRPIKRLARAAEVFGRGLDYSGFKPQGAIEVRRAGRALLQMRERLRRQIEQRTAMLAGVSHDLRTPLTRMKLELAFLEGTPEAEALQQDVTEMERMIEGYLAFARGEGGETPQIVDLAVLIQQIVQQFRREGFDPEVTLDRELRILARPEALRRCLSNLLQNARRYGRTFKVSALRRPTIVEVLVDDDGPGIPPASREDVFKPFVRLERSRNPDTGGTGLGLPIARDIARGHGGDLVLEDSPLGGLRAHLVLPV